MKSSLRSSEVRLTEFSLAVIALVKEIPHGRVATYGQIARLAGKPHAARGVGWILNSCAEKYKLPWQRVVNSKGKISFSTKAEEFALQKKQLKAEGIEFTSISGFELEEYQWKKDVAKPKRSPRTPQMFS